MLEAGIAWLTGFVFQQVLKEIKLDEIAKEAAKDWLKDFFKSLPGGIYEKGRGIILPTATKKAIKQFLELVQEELQAQGLKKQEAKEYSESLILFLKDKSVREILGSAFKKDCQIIDAKALEKIWKTLHLDTLPAGFDWELIAKQYCRKVVEIRRDSAELRAILDSENLEAINENTAASTKALESIAGIIPKLDLELYRESLQEFYGKLKLNVVDMTNDQYRLLLWKMFIPQMVREALPPSRYDLPKDIQRRLCESGQIEAEFTKEDLHRYRESYLQQAIRSVLEVLKDPNNRYVVILGDPGSGKSTLLQYLALQWAEQPTEQLPLLVELRGYGPDRAAPTSFLKFFHQGTRTIQKLNQADLDKQLRSHGALVMFDGLDEVINRDRQEDVITEIISFTNEYKKARVVVTSRIVGYNPEPLGNAEFRHFTLQDLEPKQIAEFLQKWHDLALEKDPDRELLQQRLQDAIANSKAIAELAGNPLLLTMMAILNRRQELPRNRAELYKEASKVLLYAWDVDHKKLQISPDAIESPEKQAMLRQIAYEMQSGEKGIRGNIISRDKLLEIITKFLKVRDFSQPREKAQTLINQLRERNFILCYLGDEYYGFVHRTFLEYFCAWEFVDKFEKQRILTEEELKNEAFGKHWQDESWHEVLRLICGMLAEKVAGEMIEYLMSEKDESEFINLILAAECLVEVRNISTIKSTSALLLDALKNATKKVRKWETATKVIQAIATTWKNDPQTLPLLQSCVQSDPNSDVRRAAVYAIASNYKEDPQTLPLLQSWVQSAPNLVVRQTAVDAIASYYKEDPQTLPLLQSCVQSDLNWSVRRAAVDAIARYYQEDPQTLPLLLSCVQSDPDWTVRQAAVQAIAQYYKEDPQTLPLLQSCVQSDPHWGVRRAAVKAIVLYYQEDPQTLPLLQSWVQSDANSDVRYAAVDAIVQYYQEDPQTLPLLQSCVQSDANWNVRRAAVDAIAENWNQEPGMFEFFYNCAINDPFEREEDWQTNPRQTALEAILEHHGDNPRTLELLRDRSEHEPDEKLREFAKKKLQKRS
ncbi:NACHT domain-containing protein [Argonema galeatum]|uniref:NACHT domain-containing protein n=1 Tax=Argonema galeatum TaxID=2942762 RepID=UPI002012DE4D|nr:HEAT repeat domain-containing protein [Argonema galeatum]MCL1463287.1 HEAT repeat domain-containing protein [Argonema galeatum A003/A1]